MSPPTVICCPFVFSVPSAVPAAMEKTAAEGQSMGPTVGGRSWRLRLGRAEEDSRKPSQVSMSFLRTSHPDSKTYLRRMY